MNRGLCDKHYKIQFADRRAVIDARLKVKRLEEEARLQKIEARLLALEAQMRLLDCPEV